MTGEHTKFKTTLQHKTWSVEEVAEKMFQSFRSIDEESKDAEDPKERTRYAKRFPRETCMTIVRESLKRANVKTGRITDENRQKFLQSLGTLRRKAAKRVVYRLSPTALQTFSTAERQAESCSAVELRRASKTVFYTAATDATLVDEQLEFFREVQDPDRDFRGGREEIPNAADFKTPANLVIADQTPERKFMRAICDRENSRELDAWLKNTPVGYYSIEFAWKKREHPKRGEFSPDFFIKQGYVIFVVEIKDDGEISDASAENVKKHEYATEHFRRLNEWLERDGSPMRYQFNMLSPRDFNKFFQKLRRHDFAEFRSQLDVAVRKANGAA